MVLLRNLAMLSNAAGPAESFVLPLAHVMGVLSEQVLTLTLTLTLILTLILTLTLTSFAATGVERRLATCRACSRATSRLWPRRSAR